MIKAGTRLESQVCSTQIIVIRATDDLNDLRAGGEPMVVVGTEGAHSGTLDPRWADGNVLGKRYIAHSGAEVLVTRTGKGTLSIGSTPMELKEARPLPASD
jgi:hypothetical protein